MAGINNIKKILSYSFSDADIKLYLGEDVKIVEYDELPNYQNIEDLLPEDYSYFVLFYETTTRQNGHWVCLMRYGNTIEFFDSYGLDVDQEMKYIAGIFKKKFYNSQKYLTTLIDKSHFDCIYNYKKLQSRKSFVDDCGRWVCLRLLQFKQGQLLEDFYKYLDFLVDQGSLKGPLKYDLVCIRLIPYMPNV